MIAEKIRNDLGNSSWIRAMFEEGERLRQIHGTDKVYDFSLGNPDYEPAPGYSIFCGNWSLEKHRACIVIPPMLEMWKRARGLPPRLQKIAAYRWGRNILL